MSTTNCKLPNLIIAGVHKAGTTSLYTYLAKHPQICASYTKEIGYFGPLVFGRSIGSTEEYARHFSHCRTEPFRLEASPSYLYGKEKIVSAIKSVIGDTKILIILRDPTDRLFSFFNRAVSKLQISSEVTFAEYLTLAEQNQENAEHSIYSRGIREGKYVEYIKPWQDAFGSDLRILFFEDLKENAYDLVLSVCDWLGLDAECYGPQDFSVENKTIHYRRERLHSLVRKVYMRNESFWRRNYRLKQLLRNIYNAFNADSNANRVERIRDEDAIARLRNLYEPYNKKLRLFLQSHDYHRFPSWLT